MARRFQLTASIGERLLKSKLQILAGTGDRRPSAALSILTGRIEAAEQPTLSLVPARPGRQYAARTVYLSETHLHAIDRIIEAWQQVEPRRMTRSAVLRRAVEHLRVAVEADAAKSLFVLEHQ